ncbi:hypothetical protein GTA51_12975 [Desulfovibrio aerotolerans]|uniref:Uncharacterized protein n=1 Tax=Solidesulfovibrio aerotolerans TaxID=295255 RepID=A0A7C9IVM6_9BACT|nr:hypothetical protein [Solidesulfovibrio aerotolerans]MYL84043.1 hypothetical protein [Solidesulfovibrio aerotolerans]
MLFDTDIPIEDCHDLEKLLRSNDLAALKKFEEIKQSLPTEYQTKIQEISCQLNKLDFEAARFNLLEMVTASISKKTKDAF